MNKAAAILTGAGVGAAAMFLLDPDRGRSRRAFVWDKSRGTWNEAGRTIRRTSHDLSNRASGIAASTRSLFRHEGEDDPARLIDRIRSKMGRLVSHPHAVELRNENGRITVSGHVLAAEASALLKMIRGIKGVGSVEDLLLVHDNADNVPGFSGSDQDANGFSSYRWRIAAGVAGGALAVYGITQRKHVLGKAASGAGFGLLTQAANNRGLRTLLKVARFAA